MAGRSRYLRRRCMLGDIGTGSIEAGAVKRVIIDDAGTIDIQAGEQCLASLESLSIPTEITLITQTGPQSIIIDMLNQTAFPIAFNAEQEYFFNITILNDAGVEVPTIDTENVDDIGPPFPVA